MSRLSFRTVAFVLALSCGAPRLAAHEKPEVLSSPATSSVAAQDPVAAGSQTLDLPAYIQLLDQLRSSAEGLSTHPQDAATLRNSLPKSWDVEVSGQRYDLPTGWLAVQLTRVGSNAAERGAAEKEILARLGQLRDDAAALSAPPEPDPATARAAMQEILSRREYSSVHSPSWFELAWARFWRAVGQLLDRLFGRVSGSVRARNILSWSLIGGSFLLLSVFLVRWLLRAIRSTELALVAPAAATKDWRRWAQEALTAGARGEFRAAVHACYWAGVGRLEDLGIWTTDHSRTPREYLRLLDRLGAGVPLPGSATKLHSAASPGLERIRGALGPLTGTFELIWYAGKNATAADFRSSLDRLEELGCRFPSNRPIAAS